MKGKAFKKKELFLKEVTGTKTRPSNLTFVKALSGGKRHRVSLDVQNQKK